MPRYNYDRLSAQDQTFLISETANPAAFQNILDSKRCNRNALKRKANRSGPKTT